MWKKMISSVLSGCLVLWSAIASFGVAQAAVPRPQQITKTIITNVIQLNGKLTRTKQPITLGFAGNRLIQAMAEPNTLKQLGISRTSKSNLLQFVSQLYVRYHIQQDELIIRNLKAPVSVKSIKSSVSKAKRSTSNTPVPVVTPQPIRESSTPIAIITVPPSPLPTVVSVVMDANGRLQVAQSPGVLPVPTTVSLPVVAPATAAPTSSPVPAASAPATAPASAPATAPALPSAAPSLSPVPPAVQPANTPLVIATGPIPTITDAASLQQALLVFMQNVVPTFLENALPIYLKGILPQGTVALVPSASPKPSVSPSPSPSASPTVSPTVSPTAKPSATPSPAPTELKHNITVYYATTFDQTKLYYTLDNIHWSNQVNMIKSEVPGYTKATIPSNGTIWASFVTADEKEDNNKQANYALAAGVWFVSGGKIQSGVPTSTLPDQSYTVYYKSTQATQLYYSSDEGKTFNAGQAMLVSDVPGYVSLTVTSKSNSIKASFVDVSGAADTNNNLNYTFQPGVSTLENGVMKTGKPAVMQDVTLYYRSNSQVAMYYATNGKDWNSGAGAAMSVSEFPGYMKLTVKAPGSIQASFVTSTGIDDNFTKNYTVPVGVSTIDLNQVRSGAPTHLVYYKSTAATKMFYTVNGKDWLEYSDFRASDVTGYMVAALKVDGTITASFQSGTQVDNNYDKNYVIPAGISTIESAAVKSGKPAASSMLNVRIYYKSTDAASVYFTINDKDPSKDWSDAVSMSQSTIAGYKTIVIPTTSKIIASFMVGKNADNNYDKNYVFTAGEGGGTFTVEGGKILDGPPKPTVNVKLFYKIDAATSSYYSVDNGAIWTNSPAALTKSSTPGYYEISLKSNSTILICFVTGKDLDNNNGKNYSFTAGAADASYTIDSSTNTVTAGVPK